jgi:hypothetical protein
MKRLARDAASVVLFVIALPLVLLLAVLTTLADVVDEPL